MEARLGVRLADPDPVLAESLGILLRRICEGAGWEAGIWWAPEDESGALRCRALHGPLTKSPLADALPSAAGLPGRAWAALAPVWIPDLAEGAPTRREETARSLGYRAALAVPVEGAGVFELYSLVPRERSDALVDLVRDLAEGRLRRPAEESLRRMSERLHFLARSVEDGVWTVDLRTRETWWNDGTYRLLGYAPGSVKPGIESLLARIHPDDRREVAESMQAHLESGANAWTDEYRIQLPDGRVRTHLERGYARRDASGHPLFLGGVVIDVTDERAHEARLAHSEDRLRRALQATRDGIWDRDLLRGTGWWSDAFQNLLGYEQGPVEPGDQAWLARVHPADRDRVAAGFRAAQSRRDDSWSDEYRVLLPSGICRTISDCGTFEYDAAGRPVRMTGAARDVTEFRRAEETLAESRRTMASLLGNLPGLAYRAGPGRDAEPDLVSQGSLALTGHPPEDLIGGRIVSFRSLIHPSDRTAVDAERQAALADRRPFRMEYRIRTKAGAEKWVFEHGSGIYDGARALVGTEGLVTDVSDRKRAEETVRNVEAQFFQAQKMESVGRLAGGIAHDFNNLLTAILGHAILSRDKLPPGHPVRGALDEIRAAGERAAALTRQLLAFSRKQILQPRLISLNGVLSDLETLLRRTLGEDVQLACELAPGLDPVRADPAQLGQAVMNLAVNARDAMPGGGRLTLKTFMVEVDPAAEDAPPGLEAGPHAAISVTDTGTGMDSAVLAHLFEPFFTTKEPGKGTGLGLSTTYGIVRQSGGSISVRSIPGSGSVFTLYFPMVRGGTPDAPLPEPARTADRRTERILLVEDDDRVRRLAADILRRQGHRVTEAADGVQALELLRGEAADARLVLSDVVMPRMGGRELAEHVRRERPGLPVLLMTGYPGGAAPGLGSEPVIEKPFTPAVLLKRIAEALGPPR